MIVSMRHICKDYPMGKGVTHVLKDVALDVEAGEYVAIMGPSGSGKSTLMNLIGCLDVPTSGSYLLNGADMTTLTDNQLADVRNKDIGFVFQSFHLLPKMTAVENVSLPLLYGNVPKAERGEKALEALCTVGLEDRVDHRPDQLSGGQCQRVAIARAIVGRPTLLLADEPTGALDSESGRMILGLFKELHDAGSTIIMITHDANVAAHADRICRISDGKLEGGVAAGVLEAEAAAAAAAVEAEAAAAAAEPAVKPAAEAAVEPVAEATPEPVAEPEPATLSHAEESAGEEGGEA